MKSVKSKFIKILKIIILTFLTIIIIFIASVKLFPDNSYRDNSNWNFLDEVALKLQKIGVFNLIFGEIRFQTSKEHEKALGIETAKISKAEKKELESMINKSVKAQLEYYSTEKEESLEKVKDLYLPNEFEEFKGYAKRGLAYFYDSRNEKQSYEKMGQIKFSKPRTYRDLPGRVGMISFVEFIDDYENTYSVLDRIFIFKNTDGEWKIEKQWEILVRNEWAEEFLIQKIKNEE